MKKLLVLISLVSLVVLSSCFGEKKENEKDTNSGSTENTEKKEENKENTNSGNTENTSNEENTNSGNTTESLNEIKIDDGKNELNVEVKEEEIISDEEAEKLQEELLNDIDNLMEDLDGETKK